MKKSLVFVFLLLILSEATFAQFGKLGEKIKGKISQRIDKRVDESIDKSLDKAEGRSSGPVSSNSSETAETPSSEKKETTAVKSFAKYDFVPGEQIIYSNSFETDNIGELPTGWNSSGNGIVVTTDITPGNWVRLYQDAVMLTDNTAAFSENFTVEFDLLLHRENPKAVFPQLAFGIISSGDLPTTDNVLLKQYTKYFATELKIQPADYSGSHMHLETFNKGGVYLETDIKKYPSLENLYAKPIHIAMQLQKERMKIWVNGEKMYDLPKAVVPDVILNQLYFRVKRSNNNDDEVGYMVANIRIAKGLPDTRHKLVDEGKFTTNGILFDNNTAVIKPESSGVLKEIAGVLKQYKDVRVKITGHTDNAGSDKDNLLLSQKRAEAVKQALVNDYGIEESRLETEGKGETEPVADNSTREGKASNRRVELIKI